MIKRKSNELVKLIVLLIYIIYHYGLSYLIKIIQFLFNSLNSFAVQICNTSILSIYLKYYITYPIVGLLFTLFHVSIGRSGHYIGKVLYFLVGYVTCIILDCIASFIF